LRPITKTASVVTDMMSPIRGIKKSIEFLEITYMAWPKILPLFITLMIEWRTILRISINCFSITVTTHFPNQSTASQNLICTIINTSRYSKSLILWYFFLRISIIQRIRRKVYFSSNISGLRIITLVYK
jgi:hypothetical protein